MSLPARYVAVLLSLFWGIRAGAAEAAEAVATLTESHVTSIEVKSTGSGYDLPPEVFISGGGGSGATAKAIMKWDQVHSIVILTAGSNYVATPTVTIEHPTEIPLKVSVRLVPEISVPEREGVRAELQWAPSLEGPWLFVTNLISGTARPFIDFSPGAGTRYYRTISVSPPAPAANFVWIPPGRFVMGSNIGDNGLPYVTLSKSFWMSRFEVKQSEYRELMGENPSFHQGDDLPVEMVNWSDADAYCKKLTERERSRNKISASESYRLPTEAEWEYACRAGRIAVRPVETDAAAWHSAKADGESHSVGEKLPNPWGIYDLQGNLWEWCRDWYGPYHDTAVNDPPGPVSGSERVLRGGSWFNPLDLAGWVNREKADPGRRHKIIGFRPVLVKEP